MGYELKHQPPKLLFVARYNIAMEIYMLKAYPLAK
jgi:hypothetical protein